MIFNTDQGSQFTSLEFTQALKDAGVAISMDGKGRWMDNVFIERLWRSVKWECIYLRELETGSQARQALGKRRLQKLLVDTPHQVQIHGRLTFWAMVPRRPGQPEDAALPANTESGMPAFDYPTPSPATHRLAKVLSKKSFSTVNWPILAWSFRRRQGIRSSMNVLPTPADYD